MKLRAVAHWCPNDRCASNVTYVAGDWLEDRWFAFVDAELEGEFGTIREVLSADDVEVLDRALAGFGLPWERMEPPAVWAQTMFLATAPPDFSREFMEWSPLEVRGLREGWVCGGHESFVRAIRTLGVYRRSGSWDRRVPFR